MSLIVALLAYNAGALTVVAVLLQRALKRPTTATYTTYDNCYFPEGGLPVGAKAHHE